MSGLSAAYFFIRDVGRSAKVLIIDNHDDFSRHAKRNEFSYNGRLMALNGGTLNIESWGRYNEHARGVVNDIGIDIDRFMSTNETNRSLYRSLGLTGQATFLIRRLGVSTDWRFAAQAPDNEGGVPTLPRIWRRHPSQHKLRKT